MGTTTNLALNRPTTSSSYVKPYEPARAVNGTSGPTTPTSRWLCNTLPGWMMVDLGVNGSYPYYFNRWVVRHMSVAGWQTPDYNMCDFKLQGSNNNSTWNDIDSVVGNTVGITDRTIATAVAYRYVRLHVTKGLKCNTQMASAMELEVYQSPPLSAYLQTSTGLTVSSGALSPAFVNNVFNYTTPNVANSVTSVSMKPTAEDSRATIKVNGVVVTSGNTTNVALNVGSNAITVVVTAADGRTTNTYTVTVVRDAAPPPQLSGLTINPGSLNETFSPSTTAYTANAGYNVSSITVTPSTSISGATITVNGVAVQGGTPSGAINLNIGNNNVINVVVTSGTATNTYTITISRAGSPNLYALTVQTGTTNIPLSPTFAKNVLSYNAAYDGTISSVTVTPIAEDGVAVIKVNGTVVASGQTSPSIPLNGTTTTITVEVTPFAGTVQTYTITVKQQILHLGNLQLKIGMTAVATTPSFGTTAYQYTASVGAGKTSVSVYPTLATGVTATITVNGTGVASGGSVSVSLNVGNNTIDVILTSGNDTNKYTIVVNRPS